MSPDASWSLDPGPIVAVALVGAVYVRRWRAARAQAGARAAPGWRLASFLGGLLAALLALISPIDRLAEQLFAVHMVQHVLLLDVSTILLILGLTKVILRPATRRLQRLEHAAGPLGHPAFAVAAYVVVMWAWHVPALYDAALEHPLVHVLEHLCFASVGLLYWWHLLSPIRSRFRLNGMAPVVYMLTTKLLVGLLGIGLAFAPDSLYGFYAHQPRYWGMSPGDDQAVAGLIMALEQSLVMGVALAWLFARMLGESEREDQRAERFA
jgi:putative membrane protein